MNKTRYILLFLLFFSNTLKIIAQSGPDIEKIDNAVVVILCYDDKNNYIGHGSGFFISADGLLVTNYHVLENVYVAKVKTEDGSIYDLDKIIKGDKNIDILTFTIKKNIQARNFRLF